MTLPQRSLKRLSLVLLLLGACVLAHLAGKWAASSPGQRMSGQAAGDGQQRTSPLEVAPQSLDLGTVWEQRGFPWTVTFRNPSKQPIQVVRINTSCDCMSASPQAFAVPPGGSAAMQLHLKLDWNEAQGGETQPIRISFAAILDGDQVVPAWQLRGQVRRALSVLPSFVQFPGEILLGSAATEQVTIEPHVRLQDLRAESEDPHLRVALERTGERYRLAVTSLPSRPYGTFDVKFRLSGTTEEGGPLPERVVPVRGRVVAKVRPVPEDLLFGAAQTGSTVTETLVLSSQDGTGIFRIKRVTYDGPAGTTCDCETAGQQGFRQWHECVVRQQILKAGQQASSIVFLIETADGEQFAVTVGVQYYGL
jgi:hypothetical protein